ncbi:MAG: (2Fe-2S)-binding protein [Pirellulales bacterium]|nr:(2Fe-2S)-binding protein [Pirellulales bacterium]
MPKLTIDQREVEVPPGTTILEAARKLHIEIPTLCHREGVAPSTSCLVCMVKISGVNRLVPSCATMAVDGMKIESETEEVHQVRRSALELLLSDHLGDCLAPCYIACPARMDIPLMLRQIAAEDLGAAVATVKNDIALPAVLGRICPAPCEKACRRRPADGAVAICRLKRFVADVDLAGADPYLPECRSDSGRRVAIVGAGPTGLAATYYLRRQGHACTIFDENQQPGGRLRRETTEDQLPRQVLDAEIEQILRLGVELCLDIRVDGKEASDDLQNEFDAILIACGRSAADQAEAWGLDLSSRGIAVEKASYQTGMRRVFAAGGAIRASGLVVRSVADGKEAAVSIDQLLRGQPVTGPKQPFNTKIGRLEAEELLQLTAAAGESPLRDPADGPDAGYAWGEAIEQAARCLHCDCRKLESCKLRKYAALYGADPRRYPAPRRAFHLDRQHAEIIYEPGKCIACGLCVEIAAVASEPLGLTFIGRGFDVRVGVPLDGSLRDALAKVAAECVEACPTAALSRGENTSKEAALREPAV